MIDGKPWGRALGGAIAALLALSAHASPGDGVRLGGAEARLHPFFDFEARHDSNVTYSGTDVVGDLILHLKPGLEVKAPGDAAALEFSANLDWAQYLGLENKASATPPVDTKKLSRLYAFAGLAAVFNRSGQISPRVDNKFDRMVSTASIASTDAPVVSNRNQLLLSLPWRPGGGAMVVSAKGEWLVESFEKYETAQALRVSDLGYNLYRGGLELQWRFLPRTSGVLEASYVQRKPNVATQPGTASGVNVLGGIAGLLSERIAATAKLGYGTISVAEFGTNPSSTASSLVVDFATEWLPLDSMSLRAGYGRTLGVDPLAASFTQDSVTGKYQLRFAERYALSVGAQWNRFAFQSFSGYSTTFLQVDPTLEARFGKWFTSGLGYVYSSRTAQLSSSSTGSAPPAYAKNEVFLRLGFTY